MTHLYFHVGPLPSVNNHFLLTILINVYCTAFVRNHLRRNALYPMGPYTHPALTHPSKFMSHHNRQNKHDIPSGNNQSGIFYQLYLRQRIHLNTTLSCIGINLAVKFPISYSSRR